MLQVTILKVAKVSWGNGSAEFNVTTSGSYPKEQ